MKYFLAIAAGYLLLVILLSIAITFLPKKSDGTNKIYGVKLIHYSFIIDGAFYIFGIAVLFYLLSLFDSFSLIVIPWLLLLVIYIPTYTYFIAPYKYLLLKDICYKDAVCESILQQLGYTNYQIRIVKNGGYTTAAKGILPGCRIILLGDDLRCSLTEKELEVVILQEVAHFKLNHQVKLYAISLLLMTFSFALLIVRAHIEVLNETVMMQLISLAVTVAIIGIIFYYILFNIKKKFGLKADIYAAAKVKSERVASTLNKLNEVSEGGLTEGNYRIHPLRKRLEHLKHVQR